MKLFRAFHGSQKVSGGEHTTVTKDQRVIFSATVCWNEQLLSFYPLGQYDSSKLILPLCWHHIDAQPGLQLGGYNPALTNKKLKSELLA